VLLFEILDPYGPSNVCFKPYFQLSVFSVARKPKQRKYVWPMCIDLICYSNSPVHKFTYLHDTGFPHPSRWVLVPTQLPVKLVPVLFFGDKTAERWRCPPTPSKSKGITIPLHPLWVHMTCSRVECTVTCHPDQTTTFSSQRISISYLTDLPAIATL